MRHFFGLVACLLLAACQTTNPGSAADLRYRLPRTDAKVTLTLVLKDCHDLKAEASIKIAPAAAAQDQLYLIRGADLESARIKRGLKITLNDKGVLTGVNSSVADRSPQIVGGYVGAAAKLVGLVAGTKMAMGPTCTPEIKAALARQTAITAQMTQLRADLNTSAQANKTPTEDDRVRAKDLDALSKELGQLGPMLTVDLVGDIVLDKASVGAKAKGALALQEVKFDDLSPLTPWLGKSAPAIGNLLFGLGWSAEPLAAAVDIPLKSTHRPKDLRPCGMSMMVPNITSVVVTVVGQGAVFVPGVGDAAPTAKATMALAQLAPPSDLCLDAGFGESRSLELAFDDYGRVTSYNWTSDARAEAMSGLVSGSAGDVATLAGALHGKSDLDRQKAEIDVLDTAQKLAKLRACQATLDAGGTC